MSGIAVPLRDSRANYPLWSLRPGAVETVAASAGGMPLWLAIRSINGQEMQPCIASEASLAALIGSRTRGVARRRLDMLRSVPGLLLEIERGRSSGARMRPIARWATDPARSSYWFQVIVRNRLPAMATSAGLGAKWYEDAEKQVRAHARLANGLQERLVAELGFPCPSGIQYAVGDGMQTPPIRLKRVRKRRRSRRGRR